MKTRGLEQCEPVDQRQPDARHNLIGKNVLNTLGEPPDLLWIHVRPLWDQHYRVNVVVGANTSCARVANSYFLRTNEDGSIVSSTPTIRSQYNRVVDKPGLLPSGESVAAE